MYVWYTVHVMDGDLHCNYLVADHQLYSDVKLESARRYVQYMHRAGEDTGMGSSDVDLVTISLVSHELPQAATKYVHYIVTLPPEG